MIAAQLPNGRYIYADRDGKFAVQPVNDNWWKKSAALRAAFLWFLGQWVKTYGGSILEGGTLQMRDPNDNACKRFQYQWQNGVAVRRVLPSKGDWRDRPAQWEPFQWRENSSVHSGPIEAYFLLTK